MLNGTLHTRRPHDIPNCLNRRLIRQIVGRREVGPEDVLGGLDGQFDYATATHSLNDNALWPPIAVAFQPHTTDFLMLLAPRYRQLTKACPGGRLKTGSKRARAVLAREKRTAHHEAGHTVIGRVLGMRCGKVSMVSDFEERSWGHAESSVALTSG